MKMMYTVEPLIKDTPNKGHLSIKDTCFCPMLIPLNKGHLCIKNNFNGPRVCVHYIEVPLFTTMTNSHGSTIHDMFNFLEAMVCK